MKRLREVNWLHVLIVGLMFWLVGLAPLMVREARAEGLVECLRKMEFSHAVAKALDEGYALESINFAFPPELTPAQLEASKKASQEIAALTARLYAATAGQDRRPDRAAQAYLEQCAYEYGKLHRMGSAPPPSAHELLERIAPDLAASSQAIEDQETRVARCNEQLEDVGIILGRHSAGQSFQQMRMVALKSVPYLGQERFDKIMKLIDEAEASGDVAAWHQQKRAACEGTET